MAGLNQEIWTDVLVEEFRATEEATFLNEITDRSDLVMNGRSDNDTIHLVDVGVDPEVLINNTTYPIPTATQTDGDIPINLHKFQTEVTIVTDDEIQYITYDKIALVQKKHSKAVNKAKFGMAAHALAPQSHTEATPVIVTTGPDDGTGRKMLLKKDIITLKRAFDNADIDDASRILVLSADHYNDLLEDPKAQNLFPNQSQNEATGKLNAMLAGFKLYAYNRTPYFNDAHTKKSYGAAPVAGDYRATIAFVADDMFKATGRSKNYEEKPKPRTQQWEYNIRHNFIALPRKQRAIGAIVSVAA